MLLINLDDDKYGTCGGCTFCIGSPIWKNTHIREIRNRSHICDVVQRPHIYEKPIQTPPNS